MGAFKPIVVDLVYESQGNEDEHLYGVDVSAHLLLVFEDEQRVLQFEEEGPADFYQFSDLIQQDPVLDADRPFNLPGEFSFQAALEGATEGRYGSDLLDMWRGWKAEAEAEDVLRKRIEYTAELAAERLASQLQSNPLYRSETALRHFLRAILKQPAAIDLVAAELASGNYGVIDTMKALNAILPSD